MPKKQAKKSQKVSSQLQSASTQGQTTVVIQRHESITQRSRLARLLIVIGILCALLAGGLAVRIAVRWYAQPPLRARESNVDTISGWMTLGYVSRTYGVPLPELEKSIGLEPGGHHKKSIETVAGELGISSAQLIDQMKKNITEFQSSHPTPPPR